MSGPLPAMRTSLMAFELAAANAGVALGRTLMIGPALKCGRLVAPFALAAPVNEGFYLTSAKLRRMSRTRLCFKNGWWRGRSKVRGAGTSPTGTFKLTGWSEFRVNPA